MGGAVEEVATAAHSFPSNVCFSDDFFLFLSLPPSLFVSFLSLFLFGSHPVLECLTDLEGSDAVNAAAVIESGQTLPGRRDAKMDAPRGQRRKQRCSRRPS